MLRQPAQQAAAICRPAAQAARCRLIVQAAKRRPCGRLSAVSGRNEPSHGSSSTVYVLPEADPISQIFAAQAAAEAAQQELMTSGRLAEVAAENELLSNILNTYTTLQRLYHKALRPFLDLHPQYAGSPAGGGGGWGCMHSLAAGYGTSKGSSTDMCPSHPTSTYSWVTCVLCDPVCCRAGIPLVL